MTLPLSGPAKSSSAEVQERKSDTGATSRIAVIGCGYWGKNLVRNFHSLGALAAIFDSDEATAGAVSAKYGAENRAFTDILADTSIVAVAIAAPAERHFVLAREALLAGKDVFVEKPLALEVAEAESLCALAQNRHSVLMVGHLLQYHPVFVKLKEMVDAGELGRIQYLYSNRLNLGRFRREENILWSFAPHDISMILSLVGQEPDSVTATGARYLHKLIADVTTTHLSFPGGEQAHVFVSWLHPMKEQRLVVVGDRQMAVFDDGEDWDRKLRLYPHRVEWHGGKPEPVKAEAVAVPVERDEPLALECKHFLECVKSRATPRTDGREGVRVLRVLASAERAMIRGGDPVAASASPPQAPHNGVTIHESAYIDEPCEIGPGTRIWHFAHVLKGSTIGAKCVLGQNVVVGPNVKVGDNCKIQNNVSLYEGVELEDGVFCGPSCVFTNVYNPRAEVERKSEFRKTLVRRGATIGANATIVCGVTLGEFCFVAAGAVVKHNVPPHAVVAGVPAHRIGWASHAGEILGPDLVCPRSGRKYELRDPETLVELTDAKRPQQQRSL
jgi:predicted dehydrogenase/carbonic anhydrase/acetyltransferase-like protein (isoleucine patch superfamily)